MDKKMSLTLLDYNAIGFDLDHTLAKYHLIDQMNASYHSIIDYLVHQKGFKEDIRSDLFLHKDFLCKGLFVDTEKGNILKLSHLGKILRASHGTRSLTQEELISTYGHSLIWEHFKEARNAVTLRSVKETFVFWENYFDIPGVLVCAQLIDYLDQQNGGSLETYRPYLYEDCSTALNYNYRYQAFTENTGYFFPRLKAEPQKFYQHCSEGIKQWLKELKAAGKCVFLITSSHVDFASFTAHTILGLNWKSFFDIIVTNARKPGFFKDQNPFRSLDGVIEQNVVQWTDLKQHEVYSSGNHQDLERFISKLTGVFNPQIAYFGDSLCSDAFPVKTFTNWDVILVIEEMEAEGYHPDANTHHYWEPEEKRRKIIRNVNLDIDCEEEAYLLSKRWGSFFYHPEDDPLHNRRMNTFYGELVTKYCDIAIPSIEYIAGLPIDHIYKRFDHDDNGNTDGFSPAKPKPLLLLL